MKEIKVYLLSGLTCGRWKADKKPGAGSPVPAAASVAADPAAPWALGCVWSTLRLLYSRQHRGLVVTIRVALMREPGQRAGVWFAPLGLTTHAAPAGTQALSVPNPQLLRTWLYCVFKSHNQGLAPGPAGHWLL